jgi:hypothetical protein
MFLRIRLMPPFPLGHYSGMTRWIQIVRSVVRPRAAAVQRGVDPTGAGRVRSQLHERSTQRD